MRILLACCILLCSTTFAGQAQDCGSVVLTINGHGQEGTVAHHQLAQADSLVFTGADCNRLFRIYTFELRINDRKYHTYGNRFSDEMKAALRSRKAGDVLHFSKIKTKDRSNPEQIRMVADQSIRVVANE
jgi:hypothetical protein